MILRILAIVFPVFAIAAIGYAYGRKRRPELTVANRLNMDVFIPALVFGALAAKSFQPAQYQLLAVAGLLTVIGSGLAGWLAARLLGVAPRTFAPPIMFNNSGNLGLPLAVLAFGDAALAPAVLNYVFAERYRQEPDKVASIVMIGNLASLLFIPLVLGYVLD